jgi:hypothetical protein
LRGTVHPGTVETAVVGAAGTIGSAGGIEQRAAEGLRGRQCLEAKRLAGYHHGCTPGIATVHLVVLELRFFTNEALPGKFQLHCRFDFYRGTIDQGRFVLPSLDCFDYRSGKGIGAANLLCF